MSSPVGPGSRGAQAFLVLASLAACGPGEVPPPRPGPHAASVATPTASILPAPPVFPHHSRSAAVAIHTDVALDLEGLQELADRTLDRLRGELEVPPERRRGPYEVYLCADIETVRRLEASHGLPRSDPAPERTFAFRGGFYAQVPMIAVCATATPGTRWLLVHELSHAVFHEAVGRSCDAIDEGLANHSAAALLGWPASVPTGLGGLDGASDLPSLGAFFALDYWGFRTEADFDRNYALAYLLVHVLRDDPRPALRDRFTAFLGRARDASPWPALLRTYDRVALEGAWHAAIREVSRWSPVFGGWRVVGAGLEGQVDGGVAIVAGSVGGTPGRGFTLECRLSPESPRPVHLGFALGIEEGGDYVALFVTPGSSAIGLSTWSDGQWRDLAVASLAEPAPEWSADVLHLACDPDGRLVLGFGERTLASFELGERAFRGRAGLFAEPGRGSAFETVDYTWAAACEELPDEPRGAPPGR